MVEAPRDPKYEKIGSEICLHIRNATLTRPSRPFVFPSCAKD
jgi:hypothetical protein